MTAMATPRKSLSIHDYPEHLNPFHEDDNHNKIRFWTINKKLNRSNSISFSGFKDLKNSWAFRSFMRKGKKNQQTEKSQANGESSPILYRRALQYSSVSPGARSTVGSPGRYVYGGSVTPLPRSRFQERLRSSSQYEVNSLSATPRMARSEVTGSRLSVGSTNPFDEDEPVPPVRTRRKKKRAPLPPSIAADVSTTSTLDTSQDDSELQIREANDSALSNGNGELENEDVNFNIELKIVEDDDIKVNDATKQPEASAEHELEIYNNNNEHTEAQPEETENSIKGSDSEGDILARTNFEKIDIVKYRRNSSVNEDDIRLRRGNLEDFHALSNKRSKSLTNALNSSYTTYDIDLNDNTAKDANGNEEPSKVVCKMYDETPRKLSIDTVSSTDKEFMEIDRATRELEREISKLNSALHEDEDTLETGARLSVSDIKRKFDKTDTSSPNPIPKPRRSHYGDLGSPVNGNIPT